MTLKNYSKYMVIAGTLLIWFVKFLVRPFIPIPFFLQPLVDVIPNLLGSFLIPFSACWLFKKHFKFETIQQLRISCTLGLILVVINEYLQLLPFFGRTFDYLDIFASFIGVFIGHKVFYKLMLKFSLQEV